MRFSLCAFMMTLSLSGCGQKTKEESDKSYHEQVTLIPTVKWLDMASGPMNFQYPVRPGDVLQLGNMGHGANAMFPELTFRGKNEHVSSFVMSYETLSHEACDTLALDVKKDWNLLVLNASKTSKQLSYYQEKAFEINPGEFVSDINLSFVSKNGSCAKLYFSNYPPVGIAYKVSLTDGSELSTVFGKIADSVNLK